MPARVDGRTKPRKEVLIVMIATRYLRNIGGIVGDDRNCASLVAEKQPKRGRVTAQLATSIVQFGYLLETGFWVSFMIFNL